MHPKTCSGFIICFKNGYGKLNFYDQRIVKYQIKLIIMRKNKNKHSYPSPLLDARFPLKLVDLLAPFLLCMVLCRTDNGIRKT